MFLSIDLYICIYCDYIVNAEVIYVDHASKPLFIVIKIVGDTNQELYLDCREQPVQRLIFFRGVGGVCVCVC